VSGLEQIHVLTALIGDFGTLQVLRKACHAPEVLSLSLDPGVGRLLNSIASDSPAYLNKIPVLDRKLYQNAEIWAFPSRKRRYCPEIPRLPSRLEDLSSDLSVH